MKKAIFILLGVLTLGNASVATDLPAFFSLADAFLKKNVENGKVHYKEINANFSEVESLYKVIEKMDLSSASDASKKAFYINAYNIIVIYQVSKYYPLKSPLDRSGFFDKVKHTIGGETMTLNALEIKKLVLTYKDPRIHFVLACAAKSCPPLASFAYQPDQLDKQLDTRTKLSVNNKEWLRLSAGNKQVSLSKIFDWYKKDFTMNGENTVLEFINKYRASPIPGSYTVSYYEYDWGLNEG